MNIFVVGGGPSGLLAAAKLSEAGFKVTVIEEHSKVGFPEHCTGIVRENFVNLVGYSDLKSIILAKYTGGYVSLELGNEIHHVDTGSIKAVMIDRPLYERVLSDYASCAGAQIILGKPAKIVRAGDSYAVKFGDRIFKPDLIIGARGPRANPNLKVITGLQAYVLSPKSLEQGSLYVAFSRFFADFFGWVAPYGDGTLTKVGVASASKNLRWSLIRLGQTFLGANYKVKTYFGGLVVVGAKEFIPNTGGSNYVPIGDEAGLVKPLTGGGLDLGVLGVKNLVEDVRLGGLGLEKYRMWLRKSRFRLFEAQILRGILFNPHGINKILLTRLLKTQGLGNSLKQADFDDHVGAALKLIPLYLRSSFEGFL
ncbi:hypothetical protein B9Q03_02655 [Candidatus Marsarchaeota G2 archaeon OSP_D]|jgi:Dehydrogenases (flavoproteins)|uniref:FAD-binding domain-containing protein n=5 Tax=Candidatus Marsarchaeota group 2 TaxID=2203771 RepID=A0A2R6BDW7_9ARCH|nr:MAG: hypothetical protein B9Q03_02655 [Candidatus Marsarchaeota G2 archaeon OSP_D]PSN92596.1 MAG: hypothetical protein B9Q08_01125 [Candidatus Marsarchaeota G2 archaeon ECH_B_SAG-M15]PSN96839.1 MAG: hypothetical protein B9Q06_01530 [Candidatus Marsarchaeota G2 archaeon ECH_B_2]PSO01408.1 MAG: hypothetical protein B9Q07_00940 [Candidatus Marsarchaeota G2 archaeon ECH_B_3]PSO03540.1 MAG: hypothetical protein B9Q05_01530 [Candidatus Marsarchaeota G2 archaeon ECH_B_1]